MDDSVTPPYRYPTTVLVIDDDPLFLQNFSLELSSSLAFRLSNSPRAALPVLEKAGTAHSLHRRFFRERREAVGWPMREHLVSVDLAAIEEEVTNPDRYKEVSVVVVDYAMPEMDGLAFCKALSGTPVKRILLTGVGDEKLAVSAFNEGLIDRFILKSRHDVADQVNSTLAELQEAYFREVSRVVRHSLVGEEAPFLEDPAFKRYFDDLLAEHQIVEYYFVSEPAGFLLLTASGRAKRMIVMTDASMVAQWEIAADQHAPAELIRALGTREAVPWFWRTGGYYQPSLGTGRDFLVPAQTVEAAQTYHVGLVDDPPIYRELGWRIACYDDYLDKLDRDEGSAD